MLGRQMAHVAGADGARGGWAVVSFEAGRCRIGKVGRLSEIFDGGLSPKIVAVDIPIGLLDGFEAGGRRCDREARKCLGKRAASVFPAPVRPVLKVSMYEDACALSRESVENAKAISKQTWAIVPKIREVDDLLRTRPALREIIHEVHPEVCFRELAGAPMKYSKKKREGQDERKRALRQSFPDLDEILTRGRKEGLASEDIVDAAAACCSALRLAAGEGRSLIEPVPRDRAGLPMTIWV
jgi:predicted RNase H-like nuclease